MGDQDRSKQDEGARPRPGNGDQGAQPPREGRQERTNDHGSRERPQRTNDNDDR